MNILFVNIHPYLPQLVGGVETSTHQLGLRVQQLGHRVAVMSGISRHGPTWWRNCLLRRLTRLQYPADRHLGLKVYRGHNHLQGLQEVAGRFKADVLVVSGGTDGTLELASACAELLRLPTYHYFHDLASVRRLKVIPGLERLRFLANSRYTADRVAELLGKDAAVLPPLVEPALYQTPTSRRHVTMINPRQIKGGGIALQIAELCPDIPFVFVEAWTGRDAFVESLRDSAARLPNVTWRRSTPDIRRILRSTRVMLMPSQWEETWGRIATEAHISGIPVLSSNVAALPESVGPGGVQIDRDAPATIWRDALVRMWSDAGWYQSLCDAARNYAGRDEILPASIAARFLSCIEPAEAPGLSAEAPYEMTQRLHG